MKAKMPYVVLVIKTDGTVTRTEQPKAPSYDQLKEAVGGYIETVAYLTKAAFGGETLTRGTAFANEEGLIKGLPTNHLAMAMWRASCPGGDPSLMTLVGDVIFYARKKSNG